jgi:hypothetical protein
MTTQKVKKDVRTLLPSEFAKKFVLCAPYLSALSILEHANDAETVLKDKLGCNDDDIGRLQAIGGVLESVCVEVKERVDRYKVVNSTRSLLSIVCDGESHLKIYPDVNFN